MFTEEALQAVGKTSQCFSFVTEYDEETTQFDENGKWLARKYLRSETKLIHNHIKDG